MSPIACAKLFRWIYVTTCSFLIVYIKKTCVRWMEWSHHTFNIIHHNLHIIVWSTYFTYIPLANGKTGTRTHCIINECNKPYGISLFSAFPIIAIVMLEFPNNFANEHTLFFPLFSPIRFSVKFNVHNHLIDPKLSSERNRVLGKEQEEKSHENSQRRAKCVCCIFM